MAAILPQLPMPADLPATAQLALASGYAAYLIAYRGIREHHKTIDTAFLTLVFSLAATGIAIAFQPWPWLRVIAVTFAGTVCVGAVWRMFGIRLTHWITRSSDLSWSDDTPSAWAGIMANSRYFVTQISVQIEDGTWLDCDDTRPFADLPFGPCRLGTNGDVILYLTHTRVKDGERRPQKFTLDPYGARLTYVPATNIRRVAIRHQPLVLRSWRQRCTDLARGVRRRCLRLLGRTNA